MAHGQHYGYHLRRALEDTFGPAWRIDFGQLYRLLATMKRRGWVTARVEPGAQGPDRKVYVLTAEGRQELERWLSEPEAGVEVGRDALLVKLRLGLALGGAATGELIAARRHLLEAERDAYQKQYEAARRERDAGRWLIAEAALRQTEASLTWLDACQALIPSSRAAPIDPDAHTLVAIGSDDPALELLARFVADGHLDMRLALRPVGSLEGLLALREGSADLAGLHLLDPESGEYNAPFVKRLLLEEPVVLVNLAYREQGLMIASGNPKSIRGVHDLARPGVHFVNRQRGAGTRLLVYHRLRQAGIAPQAILGYDREAPTHNAVAAAIAAGTADAGPGIRAVAEAWGLAFIPLGQERFDLAIRRAVYDSPRLRPLLEVMHQSGYRQAAAALSGYDVARMGLVVAEVE
jgi:molybdate-binding protein/DNA-binding PadR family transcriptional regulator